MWYIFFKFFELFFLLFGDWMCVCVFLWLHLFLLIFFCWQQLFNMLSLLSFFFEKQKVYYSVVRLFEHVLF